MHEYPHIWPQGGLFALSGLDGATPHDAPLIARGIRDGIGWTFCLNPSVTLFAAVNEARLSSIHYPTDYCLSDCWHCTVGLDDHRGYVTGAFVDGTSLALAIAFDRLADGQVPSLIGMETGRTVENAHVFEAEGCWLALTDEPPSPRRQFGIAVSYQSEAAAVARARAARAADLEEVTRARLAFYSALEAPQSLAGNRRRTYYKALTILKANVMSPAHGIPCRWTTSHRTPQPTLRLRDSAVHSLGLRHLRVDVAEDALHALFTWQDAGGNLRLPEGLGQTSAGERAHAPIAAWALWRQFEAYRRTAFLHDMYPRLVRYLDWFETHRKNANGLYGWRIQHSDDPITGARGQESGMDNSPRFDHADAVTAVDLSSYICGEYLVLEKMAKWLEKPSDAAEWAERRRTIADLMNELLWDDEDTFYYDLDEAGDFIPVKTSAGFLPLHARVPDRDRAEALRMHLMNPKEFRAPLRLPSVSLMEESFSKNMWRGPAWLPLNLLVYYGLMSYGFFQEAREVAHSGIDEVVRCYLMYGCFYEYYDTVAELAPFELPRKDGVGSLADTATTAAAFLDLIHEIS